MPVCRVSCKEDLSPWHRVKEVWHYRRKNHTRDELYLAKAQHAQRLVLKSRKEVRDFLNTI